MIAPRKKTAPRFGRLSRRRETAMLRSVLTSEQLARALRRERARSDRSGEAFALAVFTVDKGATGRETLAQVARILKRRLRLNDDAGRLGSRRVAVVLPATDAAGAWTVIDDVCVCVPAGLPLPKCNVYSYPTDGPFVEYAAEDEEHSPSDVRPAKPMEPLFVQRLPLWKRAIDVVGASVGLLLLSPILAIAALAIRLTSPGPALFWQRRTGLGGRAFFIAKFRTMVIDAEKRKRELMALNEQDGPAFKIKADPRITRIGHILRSTSIDELPQLWNVLRGDMSLVGPRPLPCNEAEACQGWLRQRVDVTPGLTCIWQVRGRSKVSFADWVRMDVQYIRSRSIKNDVKLLLQTVPAVFSRRGAS